MEQLIDCLIPIEKIQSLVGMEELKKSEILQMLQTLPQAGGATPEGKAMAAAPAVPGMMP